jgi:hypothetical protein
MVGRVVVMEPAALIAGLAAMGVGVAIGVLQAAKSHRIAISEMLNGWREYRTTDRDISNEFLICPYSVLTQSYLSLTSVLSQSFTGGCQYGSHSNRVPGLWQNLLFCAYCE